jgi:hypothetical protein
MSLKHGGQFLAARPRFRHMLRSNGDDYDLAGFLQESMLTATVTAVSVLPFHATAITSPRVMGSAFGTMSTGRPTLLKRPLSRNLAIGTRAGEGPEAIPKWKFKPPEPAPENRGTLPEKSPRGGSRCVAERDYGLYPEVFGVCRDRVRALMCLSATEAACGTEAARWRSGSIECCPRSRTSTSAASSGTG